MSGCAEVSLAQTPTSPVQLTTNTPYLEPSTGLHWYYNGITYLWYKALGVKDSMYYITPYYAAHFYQSKIFVSALDYGIIPDSGITDNVTNLRRMFSDPAIEHKTIIFPAGTVYSSDSVRMIYACNVVGNFGKVGYQGTNGSSPVGTYKGGSSILMFALNKSGLIANAAGTTIQGMAIKSVPGTPTHGNGITVNNGNSDFISMNSISDFYNNLVINSGVDMIVSNNLFLNPIHYNVSHSGIIDDEGNNDIFDNMFDSSKAAAEAQLFADNVAGLRIHSNMFHIATGGGLPYPKYTMKIRPKRGTSQLQIYHNTLGAWSVAGASLVMTDSTINLGLVKIDEDISEGYTSNPGHDIEVIATNNRNIQGLSVLSNSTAPNGILSSIYLKNINGVTMGQNMIANNLGYASLDSLVNCIDVDSTLTKRLADQLYQSHISFGTGVQTALGVNIGSAGAPVLFNGAGGTPTSMVGTNITGTATALNIGGNAATATNALQWDGGTTSLVAATGRISLGLGTLATQNGTFSGTSSGTNTGDQTITLTGEATGSGTGSFATVLTNSAIIGKVLTGYTSGAGTVSATDNILQAIQKLNGNIAAIPAGATGGNPTATASFATVNGSASTFMRSDAAPKIDTTHTSTGSATWSYIQTFLTQANAKSTYQTLANLATSYSTINNTLYPSIKLLSDSTLHPNKNLSDVTNKPTALTNLGAAAVGQTMYIGTTAHTLNRASASEALTGITSIDGSSAKWTTARTLSITGDIAYTSPSIDGSGNVTAAATLQTVNTNIGTFNTLTVNAKGQVTAGSNTSYQSPITLTLTGSSGASTLVSNTLNIPTYTLAGLGGVPTTTTVNGKSLSGNITLGLASADFANQGTTTTVLHGNAVGNPVFSAVSLTADVTGLLPDANINSAATWNAKQSAITFGTGVQTALGVNIGSAGAPVLFNGAGGTPTSMVGTNITGTATALNIGGNAATVTNGVYSTAGTSGYVPQYTGSNTIANSPITVSGSNVGINVSVPLAPLHVVTTVNPEVIFDAYANNVTLAFRAANNTIAIPTQLLANGIIANISGRGYGSTAFSGGRISMRFLAAEDWTDANQGTYMSFFTTPKLNTNNLERMRIFDSGDVSIGNTTDYSLFSVGSTGQFQVNSSGNITGVLPAYSSGTNLLTVYNSTNNRFETITGITAANPTATASFTAVNGSASTFMRSDAAPKIDTSHTSTGVATWSNLNNYATKAGLSAFISSAGSNATSISNLTTPTAFATFDFSGAGVLKYSTASQMLTALGLNTDGTPTFKKLTISGSATTNFGELDLNNTVGKSWRFGDGIAVANGNLAIYNSTDAILALSLTGAGALSTAAGLANGMTAITQSAGDNSTKVATTAYADAAVATLFTSGTWTPTGSTTFSSANGTYTKIGNQVLCRFQIIVASNTSLAPFQIAGLPFTSSANSFGVVNIGYNNSGISIIGQVQKSATNALFNLASGVNVTNLNMSTYQITGEISYNTTN